MSSSPVRRGSRLTGLDRLTAAVAPRWTLRRVQARMALDVLARHYEAASPGRRTSGWARQRGDANVVAGPALAELRMHARDLVRNVGWARRAQDVLANHITGGWGIVPRPLGPEAGMAMEAWKDWADSTQCDAAGQLTFPGIQNQVVRSLVTDGEVFLRKRPRRIEDGLAIPLQLQVLEADYLDTAKDVQTSIRGGPIVQGVEHDLLGRRTAYWMFPSHPGSSWSTGVSVPVPASEILHIYALDRPGQVRGVSWFAAGIMPLKDLDGFEDAELMRQKIAACFAAFVVDIDGTAAPLGETENEDEGVERFEPGMVHQLPPGRDVRFGVPPPTTESGFTTRQLRKVAQALGVTYEDLTGDYSFSNFSAARMARVEHWLGVWNRQWNLMIPRLCAPVWGWAMGAAELAGVVRAAPKAEWTAPPMPMIEPEKEGLAYQRLVRNGVMTPSEVVRERGGDPATHWRAYAEDMAELDRLDIVLDSDARKVSQAGQLQREQGRGGRSGTGGGGT